jgi:phytoene dehydrogenase-like protein
MKLTSYDAVVIGAGPNGLAAAITLARSGKSVIVYEGEPTVGGGVRSAELTLPGFVHDVCSSVYPLVVGSPFLRSLPLSQHGLQWIQPEVPLAHPLPDGSAVLLERSADATAAALGADGRAYSRLVMPLARNWEELAAGLLGPPRWPQHPMALLRFGFFGLRPARALAAKRFSEARTRALFAGLAAHAMLPLEYYGSASFALVLAAAAHAVGWPFARGGAQALAEALKSYLLGLGGEVIVNRQITSLEQLPRSRAILCDITPRQLLALAGARLPGGYSRKLQRYRFGPAAFKVDWALAAPVPWRASECARAGTVHLGSSLEEIAASEQAAAAGQSNQTPFVILSQPSLFDPGRAPAGRHALWGYCHVANGCGENMLDKIETQIERFAPGFRDLVLARHVMPPADLERHNPNLIGGDINGGSAELRQLFFRPTASCYRTPLRGLYLCSSSTPPGGGVHGMCGFFAARQALADLF